ncbi:MAG: hypothetical protein CMG00_01500 [Candidatus Marinimicrobia bacterium]|nr:hypothetical protein [Candidatus Neomarinimicrobiota bacterium]
MDEITVSGVFISLFFIFCFSIYSYFAELNVSIKLVEKKLFIRRSTLLNGLRDSSIILLIFIITYFSNLLFLEIFAFIVYFYNIGCIYKTCNHSDLAYKDLFYTLCLTSLKFLLIVVFVIISNTSNALLVSTVLCASPIYIAIFFNFKLKMLRMLYRASFLILLFFLSSVIFPYFFIACFSLMWIAKFYYFFKNNTQYPSFFNDYDKSN